MNIAEIALGMDPSDWLLVLCLIAAVDFSASFALGRPRVWYRDPLGWVIFLYSLAVVALLFLIVYAIVFGQKVEEPWRFVVAFFLLAALISKRWILHRERVRGRRANERPYLKGTTLMSNLDPKDYRNGQRITTDADGHRVTADAAGRPTLAPSPKVIVSSLVMVALVVLAAMLTAITPELLAFAGAWAPVLFAGVVALAGAVSAYVKRP